MKGKHLHSKYVWPTLLFQFRHLSQFSIITAKKWGFAPKQMIYHSLLFESWHSSNFSIMNIEKWRICTQNRYNIYCCMLCILNSQKWKIAAEICLNHIAIQKVHSFHFKRSKVKKLHPKDFSPKFLFKSRQPSKYSIHPHFTFNSLKGEEFAPKTSNLRVKFSHLHPSYA